MSENETDHGGTSLTEGAAVSGLVPADAASHAAPTMHEHTCGGGSWFGSWSYGGRCQWCGAVLPIAKAEGR